MGGWPRAQPRCRVSRAEPSAEITKSGGLAGRKSRRVTVKLHFKSEAADCADARNWRASSAGKAPKMADNAVITQEIRRCENAGA